MGTAGNLSARDDDGAFWVTASGCAKGALTRGDFVRVGIDGAVVERGRVDADPSAETSLHLAVYRRFAEARAVFHVHTVDGVVVTGLPGCGGARVGLPAIEMLKGFGVREENPVVDLAVFENHADVPRIADEVAGWLASEAPVVPGFLIRHHGVTMWGRSVEEARNRVELIDFLFRTAVARAALGLDVRSGVGVRGGLAVGGDVMREK